MTLGFVSSWGNKVKNRDKLNRTHTISCKIAALCSPDTILEHLCNSKTVQMANKSVHTHLSNVQCDLVPSGRMYKTPTSHRNLIVDRLLLFQPLPLQYCFIIFICLIILSLFFSQFVSIFDH